MFNLSLKEIERYLGYQGIDHADETVLGLISQCSEDLEKMIAPRKIYKDFPLETGEDEKGRFISFADLKIRSKSLMKNLCDCEKVVMMAVTIGPAPDRLIAKAQITMTLKALVYQAVSAAMVEAWCDEVNDEIKKEAEKDGFLTKPRFSPGYGDFLLEHQKDFARILDMQKNLGVGFSDSFIMSPSKSVTALIGLYKDKRSIERS